MMRGCDYTYNFQFCEKIGVNFVSSEGVPKTGELNFSGKLHVLISDSFPTAIASSTHHDTRSSQLQEMQVKQPLK